MSNRRNNNNYPISILLWNSNGLTLHKNELKNFILYNSIDILLITESHLTTNSSFKIPGYETYHCDHPDGTDHAGSAIFIKSIKHSIMPFYQTPSLQATNITLVLNNIPLNISSVYCPPNQKINTNIFTQFFNSLGNNFLAGGDFNYKHPLWGSRLINTRGHILHNSISNKKLKVLSPPNPTYWPLQNNRRLGILDFFVSTLPNHIRHNITNSLDLSSDHSLVILTMFQ
jgi:hypothetical protein